MQKEKVLVIGACGQLGSELTLALRQVYSDAQVLATDVVPPSAELLVSGPFAQLDILDREAFFALVDKHQFTQIYHLAAILSANAERNPAFAWKLNIDGLMNVLDVAKSRDFVKKIYCPSSIAVFGPHTPTNDTPQFTVMDPNTIYGITKLVDERLSEYYFQKFNVDIRSLRYPGLISYKTPPGGGTTDYAVDIYYKAIQAGHYDCFLREDTSLPMMYMPDAIKATLDLMHADSDKVKIRSSYNLTAMSFTPTQVAESIRQHIPSFTISYAPDFRQQIADSWPNSIDDTAARQDWGWKPSYDLEAMTADMLKNLREKLRVDTIASVSVK
ncbi:Nucleoside-diphosphate-sugar epimerase [Flexibacter flexilis DSM 6793]|uniref:Nucleoside-diphosphate-sugar epimerase n=1 Tax=Flexibacter flexilis DSM 6793 TaxID=927664 RepID=A0A1I1JWK9_9BACT|nr:NAD-dependent epimerase/dehydratase family protein [Flexibacter flexilis]SFC52362.1 Nucleoside-diphosphate-sugar epimerase [Flexibacter flexilis DSM 6793]